LLDEPGEQRRRSALLSDAASRTVSTTRNVFMIVDGSGNGRTNFGPQWNDTHTARRLLGEAERAQKSDLAADAVDGVAQDRQLINSDWTARPSLKGRP
jgi:hypothetical protein